MGSPRTPPTNTARTRQRRTPGPISASWGGVGCHSASATLKNSGSSGSPRSTSTSYPNAPGTSDQRNTGGSAPTIAPPLGAYRRRPEAFRSLRITVTSALNSVAGFSIASASVWAPVNETGTGSWAWISTGNPPAAGMTK